MSRKGLGLVERIDGALNRSRRYSDDTEDLRLLLTEARERIVKLQRTAYENKARR